MTLALARPSVVLLPRCTAPPATTVCPCGGLLCYVGGLWCHLDGCRLCLGGSRSPLCRHVGCNTPEPVVCIHGQCRRPVTIDEPCAHNLGRHACCGCCWIVPVDEPARAAVTR